MSDAKRPRPIQVLASAACLVLAADQLTKWIVRQTLPSQTDEFVVLDGFFRFVHWWNTGAAWSLLQHNNGLLAVFSSAAIFGLWHFRSYFEYQRRAGQLALGLLFGGIVGNLLDRLIHTHVVDFLRFYWITRTGEEIGFPAFNIADSAICVAVGILILLGWSAKPAPPKPAAAASKEP